MVRSLNSGVSGMKQFQQQMDVIGNNIANVNTIGFKSSRIEFADALSQTYQTSTPGRDGNSNLPALQIGTGVTTSAVRLIESPGAIAQTQLTTDLNIAGRGYFTVRDNLNSVDYVTRAGNFRRDEAGRLVTNTNLRVQGYTDSSLSTIGDIVIDETGAPATAAPGATLQSFSISKSGTINVRLSDGTEFVRGQILLQDFRDPQSLMKEGNNLYSGIQAAGPLATPTAPGTSGLGAVESGRLELSNVDLANEFANLITTQRAFQASARIITASDELLQEMVNLKR